VTVFDVAVPPAITTGMDEPDETPDGTSALI
jgi:hypothetical protein